MSYLDLTILEIHQAYVDGKVTPLELTIEALKRAKEDKDNAFECLCEEEAITFAKALKKVELDNPLWGIPYVAKDNFSTKGIETTASSNILNGYVPSFDATVIEKLREKKAILIGKTTMDELAMGGSGSTGHKGKTYNPYDPTHQRIIGGSSCGSATCVAAGIVPFALGSDTGDSVRKPAAYSGLVGMKPTWGRISRFGMFPFAPSLDHVAYFTRSVDDSAVVLSALAGADERDTTSSLEPVKVYEKALTSSLTGVRIAVLKDVVDTIDDQFLLASFAKAVAELKKEGAIVEEIHFGEALLESVLPTYMVISSSEATCNDANLDGIKFGPYQDGATYQEVMMKARTIGFSTNSKRRFVIGSYCLKAENQERLFVKAKRNRARLAHRVNEILGEYDVILVPAAPHIAPRFDENIDRLSPKYLIADNHLVLGNFSGCPSITIPLSFEKKMPLAVNFMASPFKEEELLQIAKAFESITGLKGQSVTTPKEGRL